MKKSFKKWAARLSALAMVMSLTMVAAFAAGEDATTTTGVDLTSSLETGFQGIVTQAGQVLAVIVPIALGLAGTIWLAKRAIGWFRGMAKG